ncbi:MAG: L-2-hydroxyglutarate oxidase [Nitrospirae bacterium]|nr:L-2-hydroxyglutarate oxidase [Magnetococcales bacterium]HAT50130.1 L-2-hydroxyglutarate oxidase [Alphaproteobacteria bacterium]
MGQSTDYLVVGAGIVGLAVARELRKRYPKRRITILEKEAAVGYHASGRNSGVLHSGIYYGGGTVKARVCTQGARRMKAFAAEHGIHCHHTGKIIIATSPEDLSTLECLQENARHNGVRIEVLDEQGIRQIEPFAGVFQQGIYCLDTAVIDPKAVLYKLVALLKDDDVFIVFNAQVIAVDILARTVKTPQGEWHYGYLFNCAGAFADQVARYFERGLDYALLPFKGIYFKLHPQRNPMVRANIYPVPDMGQPFLGVHVTRSIHGEVYAGPTAIPALGRENYGMLQGAKWEESWRTGYALSRMYRANHQNFRKLVHSELGKYRKKDFLASVNKLLPGLTGEDLVSCDKVGIRPQLVNIRENRLEMEFILEQSPDALHVLNAISPAFTSALALAEWIVDQAHHHAPRPVT